MKITMDMSSYEIEHEEIKFGEYGRDNMNTVRDPAVELVCGLQEIESTANVTPAVILGKIYSCRQ